MTTPTNLTGRMAGSRWFILAAAGCAAVVAVIAVVVFVVSGDEANSEGQAAPGSNERVEVDYDNLSTPTIPYAEVEAWSSLYVPMQGELPEGTIYRSAPTNPRWVKVNRFTGEMHYEPKAKGIQYRPHDVTVTATLPDGESMNIEATVEVIKYESENSTVAVEPPILPRTTVTPGESVRVPLEGPQLPEGTAYTDNKGPLWMKVDRDTGEVHFKLDAPGGKYLLGSQNIMITGWTPDGQAVTIKSEVEVVAG